MLSVTFAIGGPGAGIALKDVSVGPVPSLTQKPLPQDMLDNGGLHPLATLGIGALTGVGVHLLTTAIAGRRAYTVKDGVLDAMTGAALGTCFIGSHEAEAVCLGALSAIPMGLFNRLKDPHWDLRYSVLTQAALRLSVDLVGGNPVPFSGWRFTDRDKGQLELRPAELVGNAAVDVSMEAGEFALGNGVAALLQGKQADEALSFGLIGAGYGAGTSVLANVIMGAPFRPDPALLSDGAALVANNGGADVSDLMGHTTNRVGGIMFTGSMLGAITLPGNVAYSERRIGTADIYGHEYTHRDQFAGGYSLSGKGLLRPGAGVIGGYSQYLFGAAVNGYGADPHEHEAFFYADGFSRGDAPARSLPWGTVIGAGVLLGVYGVGAGLLDVP